MELNELNEIRMTNQPLKEMIREMSIERLYEKTQIGIADYWFLKTLLYTLGGKRLLTTDENEGLQRLYAFWKKHGHLRVNGLRQGLKGYVEQRKKPSPQKRKDVGQKQSGKKV